MALDRPDVTLDVRGNICPYPLIEIKRALTRLQDAQLLEVLTDSEPTVRTTVPAFCERAGHHFTVTETGRQEWRVLIRRGARSM